MTSLLPRTTTARDPAGGAGHGPGAAGPADRPPRPLVLVAAGGGLLAAGLTLAGCLVLGVLGWFLTDAGAHGTPSDGLRVGALGWLVAHGSGVAVRGVAVTAVPLGLTLLCAWVTWRVGHRVGDALSGHGPDADRIADGERDWTVPMGTALLACGYVVVVVVAGALAADPTTAPSVGRAAAWGLALSVLVGGPALAVGSGRAAIWAAALPPVVRATVTTVRAVLVGWVAAAVLLLVGALLLDLGAVLEVFSSLGADAGDTTTILLLTLLVVPNAAVLAGSWLLGPGFTVGAGTLVSPGLTVLGPLPLLPLVPALPDEGRGGDVVVAASVVLPFVLAALAVARAQRRVPTLRWDEGALRGCVGGVAAGVLVGGACVLAGGAVGPGRMAEVGPLAGQVLLHAVAAFGIGGLLGGLAATARQRRRQRRGAERSGAERSGAERSGPERPGAAG